MNKRIVDELNVYISNLSVMSVKIRNFHWNIVGFAFKQVHEYLDTLYESFAEEVDEVAEKLKMHEEYPAASLKTYLALATVTEAEEKTHSIPEAMDKILKDIEAIKAQAVAIRGMADEDGLYDIVALMEDELDEYSKTIWFIKSMLK